MSLTQKRTSKSFAIVLVVAMVLAMLPTMAFATVHGNIDIYIPDGENLSLSYKGDGIFDVDSSVSGYHPTNFSLYVAPEYNTTINSVDGKNGAAVSQEGTTGEYYYLVTPSTTQASYVEIKATTTGNRTRVYKVNCDIPDGGGSGTTGEEAVVAYLPAPGQFTNEGITLGGWGDIFASNGDLKHNSNTGVSLGFFGGYYVYDFGQDILNSSTNPYGADFIVYGNAFWNNSEPGCVQVSEDGNKWYDIAGSRYYNDATVKDYSLTYTNPTPADDNATTAANNLGTKADVSYAGSATGEVLSNPWHNHSTFPLNCNYFTARNGQGTDMAKIDIYDKFGSYTEGTSSTGATLTLKGVMLGGIANTKCASTCNFGYCDVHPNKDLGGTIAYNPYMTFADGSDYNDKVNGTSGGDPIDISWAVNNDGTPKDLDKIRYVRIYTGTAAMNGCFGEISTEVMGVAACTGNTGSAATSDLYIEDSAYNEITTSNMSVSTINVTDATTTYDIYSGDTYKHLNGVDMTCTTDVPQQLTVSLNSNETKEYQIITQNGTEEPYITVLEFVRN